MIPTRPGAVFFPDLFLPASGMMIGDCRLVEKDDGGGGKDPFWRRPDGTESNLSAAGGDVAHADTTGRTPDDHHEAIHPLSSHTGLEDIHAESHTIASHSDTSATGAQLDTVTDGSEVDALHSHPGTFYIPIASESEDGIMVGT